MIVVAQRFTLIFFTKVELYFDGQRTSVLCETAKTNHNERRATSYFHQQTTGHRAPPLLEVIAPVNYCGSAGRRFGTRGQSPHAARAVGFQSYLTLTQFIWRTQRFGCDALKGDLPAPRRSTISQAAFFIFCCGASVLSCPVVGTKLAGNRSCVGFSARMCSCQYSGRGQNTELGGHGQTH